MSKMCTMNSCRAKSGFCSHEKMMLGMMLIAMAGGLGHWAFNLF